MEKDVIIKISTDASDSVDALEELKKSFSSIDEEAQQTGEQMAALNKKMERLKGLAVQAGATSPIGKKAIKEAAELQGQLDEINELVARNNTDFDKFREVTQIGSTAINSYAAFQSVMAIAGVENEELLQTMVKLQAAQQLLNSLEAARASLLQKNALITKGLTAVQKGYALAVGTSTKGMKMFRLALISTGIGALVVGLGLLIANFEKVQEFVQGAIDKFNNLGKKGKIIISILMPPIALLIMAWNGVKKILEEVGILDDEQTKQAKANAQARIDASKDEEKAINDKYNFEIAKAQAAGKATFELEQEKRKALMTRIREEAKAIIELARLNGELTEEQKTRAKELVDAFKKLKNEQVIAEIKEEKKKNDEFKKLQQQRLAEAQKEEQERIKAQQEQIKREDEQWQMLQEIQLSAQELEILKLQQAYDEKFKLAEGNAELEKALLIKQKEEIAAIEEQYAQQELSAKWQQAQNLRDLRLEIKAMNEGELDENASPEEIQAYYEQRRMLENEAFYAKLEDLKMQKELEGLTEEEYLLRKEIAEKEHERAITDNKKANTEAQMKFDTAKKDSVKANLAATANVLSQFSELAGAETVAGKGLAVAAATINTYRGVSDALAAQTVTPFETALKFANATAIGLAGIMNVRKILQVKVPAKSGGGGASGGGGLTLPNMRPPQGQQREEVEGTFTSELLENKEQKETTQKVVVLESDIALTRERNQMSAEISQL